MEIGNFNVITKKVVSNLTWPKLNSQFTQLQIHTFLVFSFSMQVAPT